MILDRMARCTEDLTLDLAPAEILHDREDVNLEITCFLENNLRIMAGKGGQTLF